MALCDFEFKKGSIPWNKGISHMSGDRNPSWKGGISRPLLHWRRKFRRGADKKLVTLIQSLYEQNIKTFGTLSCYYCKKNIIFGKDTIDHKIPVSRGGTSNIDNLVIACHPCNSGKRNKTDYEYMNGVI